MHLLSDGTELVPNGWGQGTKDTQPMYVAEYSLPLDSSEQCSFSVFCGKQHTHTTTKAKICVFEGSKQLFSDQTYQCIFIYQYINTL